MILLRVYFDAAWWAEYLAGCDVVRVRFEKARLVLPEKALAKSDGQE